MKKRTKILGLVAALLVVLLIAVASVPILFRDQIVARVKAEVNGSIEARIDWRDAGLSLFGDFPNLTLRLDDLSVAGTRQFAGDTLAKVKRLDLVLDLGSVLRNVRGGGPIVVRSVALDRPVLSLLALEDGTANWNITKETSGVQDQSASRPLSVSLRSLDIRDAIISFEDRKAQTLASVIGYRQSLDGDFSKDNFVLRTSAHADSVSFRFAGISYLNHVALDLKADVNADMKARKFSFAKNEIRLNDLALGFAGSVTTAGENTALDVTFNTPRTEFRHILSLVPAIYAHDFQRLRTSGALTLSGQVKGNYGKQAFPSFAVNAKVADGAFQYPDLPLPARGIALDLAIRNPGGNVDSTVVHLDRFHAVIGQQPIDASLVLRTPVSDPDVDLRLTGAVDLADVRRTVKLTGVNNLAGRIAANIAVATRMSFIDKKQYDRVKASGTVNVQQLALSSTDLPHPLAIDEASLQLTPQRAELRSLTGKIGSSDLRLSGYLENLVPFALRGDPLRGSATLASQHFNLDEWQSNDDSLEVILVPANIDVALQATVGELTYSKLKMTNARGGLRVKDRRATLESFSMNTLGGQIGVSGYYETTDAAKPTFDVDLQMKSVEIPATFASLTTVQAIAPVARYARGNVSTDIHLAGPLGKNMAPVFNVLNGRGSLRTSELTLEGVPVLARVADAVKIDPLRNPTLDSLRASIQISEGRVHVTPFTVHLGKLTMGVAGSHGIDQSLDYTLHLRAPRAELGAAANQAIAGLISRAGRTGISLQAADTVEIDVRVGGTLTSPTVQTSLGEVVASVRQSVKQAAQNAVAQQLDSAKQRVDSATDEARKKALAEAERLVQEAERKAATMREEAQKLAESVRREGNERADSLVARATNPLAKVAARAAADRLRKETNDKADGIVREANRRADDLVSEARKKLPTP